MKKAQKAAAIFLSVLLIVSVFAGCSKKAESTPVSAADFRVTAYVVADSVRNQGQIDASHFSQITDVILFGCASYDETGTVTLAEDFEQLLTELQAAVQTANGQKRLYLNLLGPAAQTESDDWNDQMEDLGSRHNQAFESGKLEQNIKAVLERYPFDGVFFDYEFTMSRKNWRLYSDFIVSLDSVLGDTYEIGMALASWDLDLSAEAKAATDRIEIMSYDLWADDGTHATYEIAQADIEKFEKAGYDKAKLDLGVPFYARPTTKEAYWYTYADYADKIDANGFCRDEETGLTASFNTCDVIAEKTALAIESGCGGMMVWHYACDLPQSDDRSLFNAMDNTIKEYKNAESAQ